MVSRQGSGACCQSNERCYHHIENQVTRLLESMLPGGRKGCYIMKTTHINVVMGGKNNTL